MNASNALGDSTYTPVVSAQTANAIPASPSSLGAVVHSVSQINLAWTDNSHNETGFKIEQAFSASGPFTQIASTAPDATAYSVTALNSATAYHFRVRASNSIGDSSYTSIASATTPLAPPAPVTDLVATVVSANYVRLTWSFSGSNAAGFRLERTADNGTNWTALSAPAITDRLYFDAVDTMRATTVAYRIAATNAAGDSSYTASSLIQTPPVAPGRPAQLVAIGSKSAVNLYWDRLLSNQTGFLVEWAPSENGPWNSLGALPASATSYVVNVDESFQYYYRVRAYNPGGNNPSDAVLPGQAIN